MGEFYFRLESLLKITRNREEEAKKQFANCINELNIVQKELQFISQKQRQALRELVEEQKGSVSINTLVNNHQYCQFLKNEVEKKQNEVIQNESKVELARTALEDAVKNTKKLEKMKENQYQSFVLQEKKLEQNMLDEIANNLFFSSAGGF